MNFLAHLHLGRHTPDFLLGSLLGDFVRGHVEEDQFTPEIREGIRLHRAIDAFTDNNPHWKESKYRLPKPLRRYAGIIVDVFYDHLLTLQWNQFSHQSLPDFIALCHRAVLEGHNYLEPDWHPFFDRFVHEDFLSSYGTIDGIGITLERISLRSPKFAPLAGCEAELFAEIASYEKDFLTFYPEAMEFASQAIGPSKS